MTSFRSIFGCDLRSLALFRIGLGLALLIDLFSRARDFQAHYTYSGVIPHPPDLGMVIPPWLQDFIGSSWFVGLVFFLAWLAALALLVGYKTRPATIFSWLLLTSIQTRNPLIIQGGDHLLLLLLFWGIFLPLGARYSIDTALNQNPTDFPNAFFSMGTLAILLQVACLYFFSALFKDEPEWFPDGTALYYVLHMESFVLPFGVWLREFGSVLQGLTLSTWTLELFGPFLLFSPWLFLPLRLSLLFLFLLLHLGIAISMNVGLFPLFNVVSLFLFIPSWLWNRQYVAQPNTDLSEVTIYFDGDCNFCEKMARLINTFFLLPNTKILPAQQQPFIMSMVEQHNSWVVQDSLGNQYFQWSAMVFLIQRSPLLKPFTWLFKLQLFHKVGNQFLKKVTSYQRTLSRYTQWLLPYQHLELHPPTIVEWFVGLLAIYMVFINFTTLPNLRYKLSDPFEIVKGTFQLTQRWNMFAPVPKTDGWYVIPGQLVDGRVVDVYNLQNHAPNLENTTYQQSPFTTYRWRKYLQRLGSGIHTSDRKDYAEYLCRLWNEKKFPSRPLDYFTIYYIVAETPPTPSFQPKTHESVLIWEQKCS